MSDNDQKKNNGLEPDERDINLLPESLRQAEDKELMAKDGSSGLELRVPKLDKKKLPEGKVPWFSFGSWFRKEKKSKELSAPDSDQAAPKPKLIFKIIKNKEEQRAQEQAKEESWKQEIINDVFAKKGLSLPENDNALFNQEKPIDIPMAPPATPSQPAVSYEAIKAPVPPVPSGPAQPPAPDMSLPLAPIESPMPLTPPTPEPAEAVASSEPVPKPKKTQFHLPHWHLGKQSKPSDKKEAGEGFQVNLMPTAMMVKSWPQIGQQLLLSAIGAGVIIGLVYAGLIFWSLQIEQRAKEIDKEIAAVEASITSFQDLKDQISLTETQIKDVQQLLSRHVYWTKFFVLLQKYTIDTVYFESFAAGVNGNMSLNAHGNDYQAAARQLKLLQTEAAKEFVKDASITSVSKNTLGGVSFSVGFTLNNSLFYYTTSTPTN